MEKLELVGVWREADPEKRGYTWRTFNTAKQGRLDYLLISEELLPEIYGIKIHPSYRSDHSVVSLELKPEDRCMCVCVCVCARARACVRACACVCVCV